jgi:hypothetical protein
MIFVRPIKGKEEDLAWDGKKNRNLEDHKVWRASSRIVNYSVAPLVVMHS